MATDNEATDTVPTPQRAEQAQKRKPGRPKKAQTDNADIADLRRMVANLQDALLQKGKERVEQQLATLAPIPAPTEDLKPGTYIQIGSDSSGAPIMGKVPWTREIIDRTYVPVTFTPRRSMDIGPHGVRYHVDEDVEVTVPAIVKDLYDAAIKSEKDVFQATKPMSAQETAEVAGRAAEQPGTKQWSRLYRLAGGLNVSQQDTPAEPTA